MNSPSALIACCVSLITGKGMNCDSSYENRSAPAEASLMLIVGP
jgi:hypothetical protein